MFTLLFAVLLSVPLGLDLHPTDRVVRVDAPRGSVRVVAGASGRLTVEPDGARFSTPACARRPPRIDRAAGGITVELGDGSCADGWRVSVPAGVSLDLRVNDGDVSVAGMSGGVTVAGRAGDVTVDVAAGSVDIDRHVGAVSVTTQSPCVALADTRTRVGRAQLRVQGHPIEFAKAPGPGARVTLRGDGHARITSRVGVGSSIVNLAGGTSCAP